MRNLAIHIERDGTRTILGLSDDPTCFYPARPFFILQPSGVYRRFESELQARGSQYWPGKCFGDSLESGRIKA